MSKTITLGSLKIEIEDSPEQVTYRFKGNVDDAFKHTDVPRIKAPKLIMDLEGITNFNSCGVREWVYLIRDISQCGKLMFVNCSIPMVDQFNMVPESLGNGSVKSFFAPYVCEDHGDVEQLLDVKGDAQDLASNNAPNRACSKCNQNLIFDAMPDSYFLFLAPIKITNKAS